MLERGALVIGLAIVVLVVVLLVRAVARRRAAAAGAQPLPAELQARFPGHGPGIVYFYGPHCGSCRQQAAILDQLAQHEQLTVVRVDATRETALADALAVATVPTTVMVDGVHTIRAINLGFHARDALAAQLRDLAAFPAHSA